MKRPRDSEASVTTQMKTIKIEESSQNITKVTADETVKENEKPKTEPAPVKIEQNETANVSLLPDEDDMDFSMLEDEENQFEFNESTTHKKDDSIMKAKQKEIENENYANVLSNWEQNCDAITDDDDELLGSIDVDIVEKQTTINFWYWDAYEDPIKLPGKVFLFGRMPVENNTKEYKSVCVTIENVQRCLYVLPRKYVSFSRLFPSDLSIFLIGSRIITLREMLFFPRIRILFNFQEKLTKYFFVNCF